MKKRVTFSSRSSTTRLNSRRRRVKVLVRDCTEIIPINMRVRVRGGGGGREEKRRKGEGGKERGKEKGTRQEKEKAGKVRTKSLEIIEGEEIAVAIGLKNLSTEEIESALWDATIC